MQLHPLFPQYHLRPPPPPPGCCQLSHIFEVSLSSELL